MKRPDVSNGRVGFTLIEMLVVIAIIAVLAGLITAGVMVGLTRMNDHRNATEINQMVAAMSTFQTQFKIKGPFPSKIRLKNNGVYDTSVNPATGQPNNPLEFESAVFLRRVWPRLPEATLANPWTNIDWSGTATGGTFFKTNSITQAHSGSWWDLEGDQCLVFFFGGIPAPPGGPAGVIGFANSPTNPTLAPSQGGARFPPIFSFLTNRLVLLHTNVQAVNSSETGTSPFYSYADTYAFVQNGSDGLTIPPPGPNGQPQGLPFAYFAARQQTTNQYNPYLNYPYGQNATVLANSQNISDCSTIGAMPYQTPSVQIPNSTPAQYAPQFQNPTGFQIISGGVDKTFGSNTNTGAVIWGSQGAGATFNLTSLTEALGNPITIPNPAADDRTNFCPNILSAGGIQ